MLQRKFLIKTVLLSLETTLAQRQSGVEFYTNMVIIKRMLFIGHSQLEPSRLFSLTSIGYILD